MKYTKKIQYTKNLFIYYNYINLFIKFILNVLQNMASKRRVNQDAVYYIDENASAEYESFKHHWRNVKLKVIMMICYYFG